MKTVITHKIQSWKHRNYCKANILLAYMALISLGSFIGISVLQLFYEKQNVKNLAQKVSIKQQAKEIAYITFLSLKKIATSNAIVTFIKEDHLHFYKIQDGQLDDLGHLDSNGDDFSIKIQPCLTERLDGFCNFEKDGTRPSLDEILNTTAEWGHYTGLKDFKEGKETICKRWEALKNQTEMTIPLFEPVITEVTQTTCNIYNPYDRKLTGRYTFCLEIDEDNNGAHVQQRKQSVYLNVNLEDGASQKISYTQIADQQNRPCYPSPSTLSQWNDLQPLSYRKGNNQTRRNAAWRRATPVAQTLPDNNISVNSAGIKRETKHWLDRLNICFNLDNTKEAYTKVGNIKNFPKLNAFLWNGIVPDKQTKPFYFNGTKMQILEQLRYLFKKDLSEDQCKKLCDHIYEKAPYTCGLKFIEQFLSFDGKMTTLLHKFTALCSRAELFLIEISYRKNTVFQLNIMRDPKSKQWYIILKKEGDTVDETTKIH